MIPTLENISEVASARIKAIRERAQEIADRDGGTVADDETLIKNTINEACRFASRAGTAQAAVQWAILDLNRYDVLEPDA